MTTTKPHIVMVEDDGFLASIYSQRLEAEGFDVSLATNGEDGLKLVNKEKPALVLLDLALPRLDGFSVLEKLKEEPATKKIPVLVFSNLGQKSDVQRCMSLGASGYLIKTHALPHEAVAKIKEILG